LLVKSVLITPVDAKHGWSWSKLVRPFVGGKSETELNVSLEELDCGFFDVDAHDLIDGDTIEEHGVD